MAFFQSYPFSLQILVLLFFTKITCVHEYELRGIEILFKGRMHFIYCQLFRFVFKFSEFIKVSSILQII